MTFQACNGIFVDGIEMGFAAISGTNFLTPIDFGIETRACSTGCYRGYIIQYEIKHSEIYIKEFLFRPIQDRIPPIINGVKPIKYSRENNPHPLLGLGFNHEYKNLNIKIPFTGSIWLFEDPKSAMYVPVDPTQFEWYGIKIPPQFYDIRYDFHEGMVSNIEKKG